MRTHLTEREIEILQRLSDGEERKSIAFRNTIDYHLGKIRTVLGTKNAVESVAKALRLGLIE